MKQLKNKAFRRIRRAWRVRKKVRGTAERPRLTVFRSNKHIYAQVIDDVTGATLASASSRDKNLRPNLPGGKSTNVAAATFIGEQLAARAKEKGIEKIAFDRGPYKFHGRIKALAEAARKAGLQF